MLMEFHRYFGVQLRQREVCCNPVGGLGYHISGVMG